MRRRLITQIMVSASCLAGMVAIAQPLTSNERDALSALEMSTSMREVGRDTEWNRHPIPLADARYLSDGVYLGRYPGFIAPGHSFAATHYLPPSAVIHIRITAHPYLDAMPVTSLYINGVNLSNTAIEHQGTIDAIIPRELTGRLAEIAISLADSPMPAGGIRLDTQRAPVNIPLLRIESIDISASNEPLQLTHD